MASLPIRVGFIGAGKMAQAIAKGFISQGTIKAENVIASSPKSDKAVLQRVGAMGCKTTFDNRRVVESSDIVFVAVKPKTICDVMREVEDIASKKHLFVSVALGVPLATMEDVLKPGVRVVRVMPNTPALVRHSASVYTLGRYVRDGDEELIRKLLSSIGYVERVPESLMDCATGLSGSGPSYGYLTIQALSDGAVKMGMPRSLATRLAAMSILGAARMVLETGQHPDSLKDDVCSPGGCTIHAVAALEKHGLRNCLISAVETAVNRSKELGDQEAALQAQLAKQQTQEPTSGDAAPDEEEDSKVSFADEDKVPEAAPVLEEVPIEKQAFMQQRSFTQRLHAPENKQPSEKWAQYL